MKYVLSLVCLMAVFAVYVDAKCGGAGGARINRREARRIARNMDYGMAYGGTSMMMYGNGCSGGVVTRTVTVYQSAPAVQLYAAPACQSCAPPQAPPVQPPYQAPARPVPPTTKKQP